MHEKWLGQYLSQKEQAVSSCYYHQKLINSSGTVGQPIGDITLFIEKPEQWWCSAE